MARDVGYGYPKAAIALAGAALVAAAFAWSFLSAFPVPTALRLALHGTVAPMLGVLVLLRPLPPMRLSWAHAPLATLAVGFIGLLVLVVGRFGFERTYSDPAVAAVVAAMGVIAVASTLAVSSPGAATSVLSGWWQVLAALIVAGTCANAWETGSSVAGELVAEFFLVGMTEELAFRGVIQGWLESFWRSRWLGVSAANWITAMLFAWMHNPLFASHHFAWYLYLLPTGLFFGVLRDRTGSWLLPGVAHGLMSPFLYSWSLLGLVHLSSR